MFSKVHKNAEDCCSYRGAAVVQVCTCNIFRFLSRKLFLSSFLIAIFYCQEISHRAAWATDPHQCPKTKHLLPRRLQSRKTWRPRCPTRCRTIPPERSASSHPSSFLLFRLPWKQHRQGHTLSQSSLRVCSITAWWADWISVFPQRFSLLGSVLEKKRARTRTQLEKKCMKNEQQKVGRPGWWRRVTWRSMQDGSRWQKTPVWPPKIFMRRL